MEQNLLTDEQLLQMTPWEIREFYENKLSLSIKKVEKIKCVRPQKEEKFFDRFFGDERGL